MASLIPPWQVQDKDKSPQHLSKQVSILHMLPGSISCMVTTTLFPLTPPGWG